MYNYQDFPPSPKLPKQWKDWCASMKLKLHGRSTSRNQGFWFNLKGRGHYWRVNCHGMFQRGDNYEDFDRWALCDIDECPLPQTKAEFQKAVRELLALKGKNKVE